VERILAVTALVTALGAGLIGGVFFAFSTFVMRALDRLPAPAAIAAMHSINIVVINPLFMGAFLGTAVLSVALVIAALRAWPTPAAIWLLAGGLLYLGAAILVTLARNVPLNDALAAVDPGNPDAARLWADYLRGWTAWNHVRAAAALTAAAAFMLALRAAPT
jgi:uncharacterized membrane protein